MVMVNINGYNILLMSMVNINGYNILLMSTVQLNNNIITVANDNIKIHILYSKKF